MNGNEEGNESEGCDNGRESSPEPFIRIEEEEWDEVGRKRMMMRRRVENKDGPKGSVVEDGRDG